MKLLGRVIAVLTVAVLSVVAVQRLVRKLYTDIGTKYVVVDQDESA